METHSIGAKELDYDLRSYGGSRLVFRGPHPPVDGRHVAFVGGTETFGKFLPRPYPALVQERYGLPCVNLGIANASIGAHLGDNAVVTACREARIMVIEVTGAHNLSNRFYTVHPRRNDRFVRATEFLRELYCEVDFADFVFTKHMLMVLHATCPHRFAIVRGELQRIWCVRMREFLAQMPVAPLLLWFAGHSPDRGGGWEEPLFVTAEMIEEVAPLAFAVLKVTPDAATCAARRDEMVHSETERSAAA
ncbi:DUF6473 family protein [Histidinibacterium aquaticum]|uniref:DUF6473 domain-containing protein n=1 Tax=Histidinibacterium aquaticum TaxID=2613962 RepID=A0A5J5GG12_9RHOB|nr:DUF6473 family protein [Histidinibacterium aquaticum]KAA9007125.1 hypothetical protein F3S47_15300 [Histidinibacterium aquaticum]